ncbi:hypothetical protein WAI453_003412 [Rhynchosporium graminicola]
MQVHFCANLLMPPPWIIRCILDLLSQPSTSIADLTIFVTGSRLQFSTGRAGQGSRLPTLFPRISQARQRQGGVGSWGFEAINPWQSGTAHLHIRISYYILRNISITASSSDTSKRRLCSSWLIWAGLGWAIFTPSYPALITAQPARLELERLVPSRLAGRADRGDILIQISHQIAEYGLILI